MKKTSEILFHIIDSENIGFINVVLTPEKIFNITHTISQLVYYDEFNEFFEELELIKIDRCRYEHQGILDRNQLRNNLIEKGFITNKSFSEVVENIYDNKYIPKSESELKELGH